MSIATIQEPEYDSDEIRHHCHSEEDDELIDPYFEYNKCNTSSFIENKLIQNKFSEFTPVNLNQFVIRRKHKI